MLDIEQQLAYVLGSSIILTTFFMIVTTLALKNKNELSFIIWHLISWISFIKWTALINLSVPSVFIQFFKCLLYIYKPRSFNSFAHHSKVPRRFSELGIDHPYFLNNAELSIVILTAILIVYLIFYFIRSKSTESVRTAICHNLIIRSALLLYVDLSTYAFLQISSFEITTVYGICNSFISVIVLTSLVIVTVFFSVMMQIESKLFSDSRPTSINTLTNEFKKVKLSFRLYYLFFMVERLFCPLVYALLDSKPEFQFLVTEIFVGIKCNSYVVFYVLLFRPFINRTLNYLVITLDFITLTIVALIACYLIPMSDSSKIGIFYLIVFLIMVAVLVNIFFFVIEAWKANKIIKSENKNELAQADLVLNSNQNISDLTFSDPIKSKRNLPKINQARFTDDSNEIEDNLTDLKKAKSSALNKFENVFQNTEVSIFRDDLGAKYQDSVTKIKDFNEARNYRDNFIERVSIKEEPTLQNIFNNKIITRKGVHSNKSSLQEIFENKVKKFEVKEESKVVKIEIEENSKAEGEIKSGKHINEEKTINGLKGKKFFDDKIEAENQSEVNEKNHDPLEKRIPFYNTLVKKYNKF